MELQASCIAKLIEADVHPVVPTVRLIVVRPEETIPPGKVKTKVAVGFPEYNGMMDSVHVGSHDKTAKVSIKFDVDPDVAVVEHGRRVQQDFKNQDGQDRRTQQSHDNQFDSQ